MSHDEGPGAIKKATVPAPVVSAPVATPVQQENVPVQRFNNSGNMASLLGSTENAAPRRNVRAPPGNIFFRILSFRVHFIL